MKNRILLIVLCAFLSLNAFAQNETSRLSSYNLEKKVAIQGYDPVSYFKQNKAMKGSKNFTATYQGVVYNFSSAANKEAFLKNPSGYEPQYGGWCAYAMGATGEKVEVDPDTFKIIDGKLFLFFNAYFNNTLKSWNKDEVNLKKKADVSWKKLSH